MTIKLDHINLGVANLQDSIEWYRRIFGFELVESGRTPMGTKWGIVAFDDSMICMSEDSQRIPADQVSDSKAHQIDHFGIRISDIEQWRTIVRENNLKLHYGGQIDYPNSTSWYVHDPSGHEIEVSFTPAGKMEFPQGGQ